MDIALLIAGGVMLYFGAEWLVSGASRLALSLRIPQLVVGLTIVAYGTSAPEVIVSIQAAAGGHGDVALGNVIGSNIANLGLILGLSVLVRPARVDGALRRRELPLLLASTLVLPVILLDGVVQLWEGCLLVLVAVAYTAWTIRHRAAAPYWPGRLSRRKSPRRQPTWAGRQHRPDDTARSPWPWRDSACSSSGATSSSPRRPPWPEAGA